MNLGHCRKIFISFLSPNHYEIAVLRYFWAEYADFHKSYCVRILKVGRLKSNFYCISPSHIRIYLYGVRCERFEGVNKMKNGCRCLRSKWVTCARYSLLYLNALLPLFCICKFMLKICYFGVRLLEFIFKLRARFKFVSIPFIVFLIFNFHLYFWDTNWMMWRIWNFLLFIEMLCWT